MARKTGRAGARKGRAAQAAPTACVGVAASIAGLPQLERLFRDLPADSGAAFVVTVRRENGTPIESVARALGETSGMGVEMAADGAPVDANRIYLAKDGEIVLVEGGRLRTSQASPNDGRVDSL